MSDDMTGFLTQRCQTADRPLQGMTVLVVEDSRFACEAMRILCLRSGARIRRADCLRSARRHLATYRPTVVIVDLGLPDGFGQELIRDLAAMSVRVPVVLGTSGNADGAEVAREAGADGFLEKPIESLAAFQAAILSALPSAARPKGPRALANDIVTPDPLALRDDLSLAAGILSESGDETRLDYVAQFLSGLAISAHDAALEAAAADLARDRRAGRSTSGDVTRITGLVRQRLASGARF
ncbi:response regulator [Ostreiculturibacter nitratireducens]|uniref:response regulator n=1 Tax=Ostreiculturibacter nitratireducens TaxID=3075226 RepID=UPI0031B60C60